MSASTQAAPKQMSFGRFPMALAAMALVVILAVVVALVALNGTKAVAPTAPAVGAPPIGYDHGSSSGEVQWGQSLTNVPFYDHGWSSAETYELPPYYGPFYHSQEQIYLTPKGTTSLGQDDPKPVRPENTGSRPRNQ